MALMAPYCYEQCWSMSDRASRTQQYKHPELVTPCCLLTKPKTKNAIRVPCNAILQTVPQTPSEIDSAPVSSVRQKSPPGYKVFASPATKHLAKENNINLSEVTGTGPEGRITRGELRQVVGHKLCMVALEPFAGTCSDHEQPFSLTLQSQHKFSNTT